VVEEAQAIDDSSGPAAVSNYPVQS